MSYDFKEKSRHGGQPVECYKFAQGAEAWLWTSADREVSLPLAGDYSPMVISRGELDFSHEDTGETLQINLPRANAVAALFIGELPSTPVWVIIHRAHRGDEELAIVIFEGRLLGVRFEESEAILTAGSLMTILNRGVPPVVVQTPCNHVLYSPACGITPSAVIGRDSVLIDSVDGATITSSDFALRDNGWFSGGRLDTPEGNMRFIVNHAGDKVTLLSALPGLEAGATIYAYWGCDHLETTCASKFSNIDNHLGWARLPSRNPFEGRID